jgi:hypothetical protein
MEEDDDDDDMYIFKHNFILGGMYYYTKAQLHVSAIKFGHLQVVHEKLMNRLHQRIWRVYGIWGEGVGARSRLCQGKGMVCFVCMETSMSITAMSGK